MQQVPKIKNYKHEMWMKLLSKISKDYHIMKQIDLVQKKRKTRTNKIHYDYHHNQWSNKFSCKNIETPWLFTCDKAYNNITKERKWKTYITTKAQFVLI
jgi:hypothetical protein